MCAIAGGILLAIAAIYAVSFGLGLVGLMLQKSAPKKPPRVPRPRCGACNVEHPYGTRFCPQCAAPTS